MTPQYPPTRAQISLERHWETQRDRDFTIITGQGEVIKVHEDVICEGCPQLAESIRAKGEDNLSICLPTVVLWELVAYLYGFDFSYDFGGPFGVTDHLYDLHWAARKFQLPDFWARAESAVCDLVRGYDRIQCFCFGALLFSDPDMSSAAESAMDLAVELTAAEFDSITAEEGEEILRNHFPYCPDIVEEFAAHVSEYATAISLATRIEQIHMV